MPDTAGIMNELAAFLRRPDIAADMEADLRTLVAVPSVGVPGEGGFPFGSACAAVLDAALALGEKYGFVTENHEYCCGSILFGEGEKEVGIVTHLDVVPASKEGWTGDPYMLLRDGDMLIGRGTEADKGPFIASLYTLRFLKETRRALPFAVRLIMGCDEESGCSDLEHYLSVRKAPDFAFTPDSEYPVCIGEKGMYGFDLVVPCDAGTEITGGSAPNAVPASARAVLRACADPGMLLYDEQITLETAAGETAVHAEGLTAHAAMPESGVNAIGVLCRYLAANRLDGSAGVRFLAESCSEYLGKAFGIDCADEAFGPLTCIGSMVSTREGMLVQNYNVRYPMSADIGLLRRRVAEKAAPLDGRVENESVSAGYYKDPDSPEIRALTEACGTVLGGPCAPYTMGGGTYARHMPGTVAFGAAIPALRGLRGEGRGGAHQVDEYITITELECGVKIFTLSLLGLAESVG